MTFIQHAEPAATKMLRSFGFQTFKINEPQTFGFVAVKGGGPLFGLEVRSLQLTTPGLFFDRRPIDMRERFQAWADLGDGVLLAHDRQRPRDDPGSWGAVSFSRLAASSPKPCYMEKRAWLYWSWSRSILVPIMELLTAPNFMAFKEREDSAPRALRVIGTVQHDATGSLPPGRERGPARVGRLL